MFEFLYLGGEATTDSGKWTHGALVLLGMFGGAGVCLLLTRLVCRRFVSLQTQKRWFDALSEVLKNPYVKSRGPALVLCFIWATVPDRDAL